MVFDISLQGITIGPLEIRFYSIMFLSGILAGVLLARREARRLGENPGHVANIAVLGVVFGLIGARLYHVLDANHRDFYRANPGQIIAGREYLCLRNQPNQWLHLPGRRCI